MSVTTRPNSPFDTVLRQIDDLLIEAGRLRERITAALVRERRPFFPERRQRYEPHDPERRKI